ncbi:MAG: LamG domain-containing protein [Pirellulales bacterium]|nr:LamG domain-containing protein [Pirellulales bacterium]
MIWQRTMVFCLVMSGASAVHAALAHRYSFTSDASDSVGGAHGAVVDGLAPTAVFAGGLLDLSANAGQGSNEAVATRNDAYVDLPNGIVSAAAGGGTLTTEIWARSAENRNWAALFSSGTSNGGEDSSNGGNGADYIQLIPRAGAAGNDLRQTTHRANVGPEGFVDDVVGGDLSLLVERHIVSVFDQSGGLPGTVSMYVDGLLIGTSPIAGGAGPEGYLNLATMVNNNNWLGRSQWPDSIFDGWINEFRIHNSALSAADVAVSFARGADAIPEPASLVLLAGLGLAMLGYRRGARR